MTLHDLRIAFPESSSNLQPPLVRSLLILKGPFQLAPSFPSCTLPLRVFSIFLSTRSPFLKVRNETFLLKCLATGCLAMATIWVWRVLWFFPTTLNHEGVELMQWRKPPPNMLICNIDGALTCKFNGFGHVYTWYIRWVCNS